MSNPAPENYDDDPLDSEEPIKVIEDPVNYCDHMCTSECRRSGCNCECGEYHEEDGIPKNDSPEKTDEELEFDRKALLKLDPLKKDEK
jgi:hypothetical protein